MNYLAVLGFSLCALSATCVKLPEDFMRCPIKLPEADECFLKAISNTLDKIKNGHEKLGIPSLNPLRIDKFEINQGSDSPVAIKQILTNADVYGVAEFAVLNVSTNIEKADEIFIVTLSPSVEFLSDYEMTGRILLLPIQGKGKSNVTLVGVKSDIMIKGDRIKRNNKIYWHIKEYKIRMFPERVYIYYENLFNGNKELGKSMNDFLNENWKEVFTDIQSHYEATFNVVFQKILNQIFDNIEMNKVFKGV